MTSPRPEVSMPPRPPATDATGSPAARRSTPAVVHAHGYFAIPGWKPDALNAIRSAITTRMATSSDRSPSRGTWTAGAYSAAVHGPYARHAASFVAPDRLDGSVVYVCSFQPGVTTDPVYAAAAHIGDLLTWIQHVPLDA